MTETETLLLSALRMQSEAHEKQLNELSAGHTTQLNDLSRRLGEQSRALSLLLDSQSQQILHLAKRVDVLSSLIKP